MPHVNTKTRLQKLEASLTVKEEPHFSIRIPYPYETPGIRVDCIARFKNGEREAQRPGEPFDRFRDRCQVIAEGLQDES